jgi:uncharacterized membrane-anchored protein YitT (DUF2179 family)
MNTQASPLDIVALGWGLSAALVVLFVICLAVARGGFAGVAGRARMDWAVFCRTNDIGSGLDRRHCL